MAMTSNSDTELLTEHFGYPPVSLLDDIINSINILAERALNSIEQGLLNAPAASLGFGSGPQHKDKDQNRNHHQADDAAAAAAVSPEDARRHEVEAGTHQLETLLCASIDRNFDKFELYVLRNILCVRPEDRDWIRLGHYEGLAFSPEPEAQSSPSGNEKEKDGSEDADKTRPTVESVNRLRRRLQASQKLNCMLHAERARNAALLRELRAVVGGKNGGEDVKMEGEQPQQPQPQSQKTPPLAFLHNQGGLTAGDADTPLTTTTAFTLSQLQALRALSMSLRSILPDLSSGADEDDDEEDDDGKEDGNDGRKKSWRRDRLEYVEGATRRHLEHVRGLELGKNGAVRDGEWQGEGRNLAGEEVEGLERVVSLLGGSGEGVEEDDAMDET